MYQQILQAMQIYQDAKAIYDEYKGIIDLQGKDASGW